MELESGHPTGAENFEVAARLLENLCNHQEYKNRLSLIEKLQNFSLLFTIFFLLALQPIVGLYFAAL